MKYNSAIILPYKEIFSNKGFGAVSVWVKDYLKYTKLKDVIVFCKKLENQKYLHKNIIPIDVLSKFYTNLNYIKKINSKLEQIKIKNLEIHNRPEYAHFLLKNNPDLKVVLIFHNDPNTMRYSNSPRYKKFLLNNCHKIIFVSNWVKNQFFKDLDITHNNKTDIIYNFINPLKKFPLKKKIIIFAGKLNISKGFHIFGRAIIKILNKYPNWNAIVYGNEQRKILNFTHKRLKINNWIDHKKLLRIYEKCSISVVNPTWDEPFGRTALESASRGCAVITSKSGGLSETFDNNLVLNNNNEFELYKIIEKLIKNENLLKSIQLKNFKNIIHIVDKSISKLDTLKTNDKFINDKHTYNERSKKLKILHISNFGTKTDHRLFNISIAKKISNGLIRNGHDVIDYDYRNIGFKVFLKGIIDNKVLSICENYLPNLVLLGHNNTLSRSSLEILKEKYKCKIAIWYEDHVIKGDPNFRNNLNLLEKNCDLIDQYFITTSPDIIKTKISKYKLNYLPIPVDPNIEKGHFYENKKEKDLFFALSHGVNYGKLKKKSFDERINFIEELLNKPSDIKFHILGLYNEQPKWNHVFEDELKISKTALNLSRGGPNIYASSNRIASLMGNGVLPFIHEKVKYQDFFDNDEIITYKNSSDLINKLLLIKDNDKLLKKRAKNSKKSYFAYFNNKLISNYIIEKIFNFKNKTKYKWVK